MIRSLLWWLSVTSIMLIVGDIRAEVLWAGIIATRKYHWATFNFAIAINVQHIWLSNHRNNSQLLYVMAAARMPIAFQFSHLNAFAVPFATKL